MMYFSWNPGTVVDEENRPVVAGRVSVFVHDSNVLASIYTMEGDQYVPAQNPQFLDDYGRLQATLFAELGVYDVKIEKANGDDTYEDFDVFEIGIDADLESIGRTEVSDIEALSNLDPDIVSKIVTVTSYPARRYIWDPESTDIPDGGVVIDSDVKGEGNWILLWDSPYLPSSVYGVKDGDITNLNALLNYASVVGSFSMHTPTAIRLESGHYDLGGTYLSTKKMAFEPDTSFTGTLMVPCDVELLGQHNGYIGDLYFTNSGCTAHSSWFRTLDAFLTCNASRFIVDGTNYFTNTAVSYDRELANVTLEYPTNTRLPITYTGGGKLTLSRVNIIGENIFNQSDILYFKYTDIMDKWWSSPANVDWVNKVSARSAALNNLRLDNFTSTTAYVKAIRANGATYLDLAGRNVSSLDASGFTYLNNIVATSLSLSGGQSNIQMSNVKTDALSITCNQLTMRNSEVSFSGTPSISNGFWAYDSTVWAQSPWTTGPQVIAERCSWNVSVKYANDNTSSHAWVEFTDCVFGVNTGFSLKMATFLRCMFPQGNTIKMYPRKDDSVYRLHLNMQDCTFNSAYPVEFTKFDNLDPNDEVYDCIVSWIIVGNTFLGNSEGLRCRYWQHRSGGNWDKTFVAFSNNNSIVYHDNRGDCPADTAKGLEMSNGSGCESMFYWLELGESTATLDKHKKGPVMLSMKANTQSYHWNMAAVNGNGFAIRWKSTGNDGAPFDAAHGCYLYPWAHLNEPTNNGSLFDVGFTKFGKIEEADPSYYPYHWQFAW